VATQKVKHGRLPGFAVLFLSKDEAKGSRLVIKNSVDNLNATRFIGVFLFAVTFGVCLGPQIPAVLVHIRRFRAFAPRFACFTSRKEADGSSALYSGTRTQLSLGSDSCLLAIHVNRSGHPVPRLFKTRDIELFRGR
jgi:hypothetical protein